MTQDNQKLLKEFKGTVKILNSYANKYSNFRVGKELKITKRKRNTEALQMCKKVIEEIDELIEEQNEVFASKRILQNIRLLNLVFNIRIKNFENFKTRLDVIETENINRFLFTQCQKMGNKYYYLSTDKSYIKYIDSTFRNGVQMHLNKCNYSINDVEIDIALEMRNALKLLKSLFSKYKNYMPVVDVRRAQKEIIKIERDFNVKIHELKKLNVGITITDECVVDLTEEDCCYFGANDYVIKVTKSDDFSVGLENDIERNLTIIANLSSI